MPLVDFFDCAQYRVYRHSDAVFHGILCGSSQDLTVLQLVTAARTYRRLNAVLPAGFGV